LGRGNLNPPGRSSSRSVVVNAVLRSQASPWADTLRLVRRAPRLRRGSRRLGANTPTSANRAPVSRRRRACRAESSVVIADLSLLRLTLGLQLGSGGRAGRRPLRTAVRSWARAQFRRSRAITTARQREREQNDPRSSTIARGRRSARAASSGLSPREPSCGARAMEAATDSAAPRLPADRDQPPAERRSAADLSTSRSCETMSGLFWRIFEYSRASSRIASAPSSRLRVLCRPTDDPLHRKALRYRVASHSTPSRGPAVHADCGCCLAPDQVRDRPLLRFPGVRRSLARSTRPATWHRPCLTSILPPISSVEPVCARLPSVDRRCRTDVSTVYFRRRASNHRPKACARPLLKTKTPHPKKQDRDPYVAPIAPVARRLRRTRREQGERRRLSRESPAGLVVPRRNSCPTLPSTNASAA